MEEQRWSMAVVLETGESGRLRAICSTAEALRFLTDDWPVNPGPANRLGRAACLALLKEGMPVDHAREAFVAAATEAGILGKS